MDNVKHMCILKAQRTTMSQCPTSAKARLVSSPICGLI